MISAVPPLRRRPSRLALFGIGLALASALSCGREVTAPGGAGAGAVQLRPVFAGLRLAGQGAPVSVSGLVEFVRVRIVLLRANGDTAVNRVVEFPADSQSLSLSIPVVLSNSAPAEGETFAAALRFVNATGDTVFSGGPVAVQARPLGATPVEPPPIPVTYTGPGATAASLILSADTVSGMRGGTKTLTATVRDAQGAVLNTVPIAYSSLDTAMATVGLKDGIVTFRGIRGQTRIVAQTLTGQADTALILVFPIPTAITFTPEAIGQQTRQRDPFPKPAVVKVTADDGLPVAGTIIDFTVTRGKGTVSQAKDTTDANGIASVIWTAGDSVGTGELSARVSGGTLTATLTGGQLNAGPTSLRFIAQPTNVVAQDTMPTISIVVLDAIADTVRAFTGPVRVRLAGGRAGAALTGTTTVNAVAGVARFTDLAVDRDGTGYTLITSLDSTFAVPSVTSTAFDVTPRPIGTIALLSGGGQTVSQGLPFPDSVIVRVADRFGNPVPNAVVRFEVVLGQGTVSPTTVTTGTAGVAATRWTTGSAGPQRVRVSVDALTPLTVDGTALASNGLPLLYVGTETASLGVGRTRPITAYLSNPARASTAITLRSRNDSIAQWTTTTATIPLHGTQTNVSLTGRRLGSTYVVLESAVGTDSVLVTVDSTGMRFGPLPVTMLVSDTIRTMIVLDAPAPTGGLTVTVRSADSMSVRVAPGSGTGALEQPEGDFCDSCVTLRTDEAERGQLLAPPSGTATLTVPAGQLSAQLIVLPVAPASDTTRPVALTASAAGVSSVVSGVTPIAATLTGGCFYCTIPIGHVDGLFLTLGASRRSSLTLAITTPDTAVVRILMPALTMTAGHPYAYPSHLILGRSAGTARVITSAPGFRPDTTVVTVRQRTIGLASYSGTVLRIGTQLDLRASLGSSDSTNGGFSYGAPLADSLTVTMTSSDTAVALPDFTRRVLAAGEFGTGFPVTGRRAGTATLSVSAPGYGTATFAVTVTNGEEVFLSAPATTGIGVITPITINIPAYGPSRLSAMDLIIKASDTTAMRVWTPRVTLASGAHQVEGRVEGLAPGTVTLSVWRDTTLLVMDTTVVVAPRLAITGAPALVESGESSEILVLTEADQIRSTSDRLLGVLRSTNPAVLQVTDSVLRFVPGEFGAVGVVRGVGAGTATLVASVPGYPADSLASITVRAPRLVIPVGAVQRTAGPGIEWRLPVERKSATLGSLPIAVSVTGSGGASVVTTSDSIAAGATVRELRVRGGGATGTDTIRVTAAGLEPASYVLPAARSWFTLVGESTVPVEAAFQVGGGLAMAPGFFDDSLTVRPVAATTLRYRLVSLDTAIVRVVEDTVEIATGTSFATRLGKARGLRPGVARLTATLLGTTGPVGDTVSVEVAPLRLSHTVVDGALHLGMLQRTEDGEILITRPYPARTPVWVRLTSSAPGVVTVPDSVVIPVDEVATSVVVTTKDTVGTALVTAQAVGHEGASFTVTATRARLLIGSPGSVVTGSRVPYFIIPAVGTLSEYVIPVFRPHTVPIPVRLRSVDTTVARWTQDSLVIAAGSIYVEATLVGQRTGTTRLSLEDRRTTFPRLTPIEGTEEVRAGLLEVTGGSMVYGGMPVVQAGVGLTSYPQGNVQIETNGYREGLVVKFRSLKGRVGFVPDTVVLRDEYDGDSTPPATASIGLRGIVAGVDTVELSAAGHRPDTVLIRIDQGFLATDGSVVTTNLRVGDSTLVSLQLRSPSGDSAVVANGMTLTVTHSSNLTVSGAGVTGSQSSATLTLPAGATHARFWVKGLSAGPSKLTVTAPQLRPFEVQGAVRSP